jgi:hypothetical protein
MGYARKLADGQVCRVHIVEAATGASAIVHVDHGVLLEAPNWTTGGDLILNGDGVLWRMPADGSAPLASLTLNALPELNNDHVLAPDGETIFVSANDGHIYAASLRTGAVARVTATEARHWHFLHGVSPDGSRLAYVALNPAAGWSSGTLRTVRVDGSDDVPLTEGAGPDDGPEYSPDGMWIYFNTERFSRTPGHAQIARIRPDGSGLCQLTFDEGVNWFPHLDPTGRRAVYLAFPPGTHGHPADLPVRLLVVEGASEPDAWTRAVEVTGLRGGQGTINVNSWSPDGSHFAYVDYPVEAPRQ